MSNKYWIESVGEFPSPDFDSLKAVISCANHGACIEVFGTKDELTDRLISIINGLNNQEKCNVTNF